MDKEAIRQISAERKDQVRKELENNPDRFEELLDRYETLNTCALEAMHERDQWKDKAINLQK